MFRRFKTGNEKRETRDERRDRPSSIVRRPSSLNYALFLSLALFTGFLMIRTAAVLSTPQSFSSGGAQVNWATAVSGATAALPIAAGYDIYDSKDAGVTAGTDIQLTAASYSALQTSDSGIGDTPNAGGFGAGTKTNTAVSSSGAAATVNLLYIWVCGDPITVNHTTANGVAPVTKSVIYGTVSSALGGTGTKCWITQNLGATTNAASATESTEPNAGWYWQFNRKQGYKYDGTTRTPNSAWINLINESSDWTSANDPCTLELGAGWRLPTSAEWISADSTGGWVNYNNTYASVLKLHTAGYLDYSNGALIGRGSFGFCWSSPQGSSTNGSDLFFGSGDSVVNYQPKAYGFTVRCLKD